MIIQNRKSIGYFLVRSCARRIFRNESISWKRITATVAVSLCVAIIIGGFFTSNQLRAYLPWESKTAKTTGLPPGTPPQNSPAPRPETPVVQAQLPADEKQSSPAVEKLSEPAPISIAPQQEATAIIESETTVAEIQNIAPDAPPSVQNVYSDLLGKLTLQPNETLSRIIQKVYGSYNSKYFRSLILANPLIDDPDRVDVGQTIALPAIPAKVRPRTQPMWWVQIEEKDTLEAAYNFLRTYPDQAPPVRLIPYWTRAAGTKFALVLKGQYATQNAANRQLRQLPPDVSSAGKIISLWSEETVFFADPFLASRSK